MSERPPLQRRAHRALSKINTRSFLINKITPQTQQYWNNTKQIKQSAYRNMVASNRIVFLTSNKNDKYISGSIRCRVAVATRKAEGSKK